MPLSPVRRAAVALVASACAGDGAPTSAAPAGVRTLAAPTVAAGDALPAPTGETVLLVTGAADRGDGAAFDVAGLEGLGLVAFEVWEPFEERRMGFQGVRLGDVLAAAAVDRGAAELHAVALNDYSVDIPLDVARHPGTLLATRRADGSAIPLEEGGPVRVVFLDDAPAADVHMYWIWSLASVDVR